MMSKPLPTGPTSSPARRRHALLLGYYGARNFGDYAMLFCLRDWLAQQQIDITVLSENPAETRHHIDVPLMQNVPLCGQWAIRHAWGRGHAPRLLRSLMRSDLLCVGGGDLLRDDQGFGNFLFSIEKIAAAILLRKPVVLLNVGISEPTTSYGKRALGWLLPRCERIIVRDERSMRVCAALGAAARTEFRTDIVLDLPAWFETDPVRPPDTPPAGRYVAVALRANPNAFRTYPVDETSLRAFALSLDRIVERHNLDVCFVPLQDTAEEPDIEIHRRIASFMQFGGRAAHIAWTPELGPTAAVIRDARFVIAMRLHAAVLAAAYGRPCVVMPYDTKVKEFGRQMNFAQVDAPALQDVDRLEALYNAAHDPGRTQNCPAPAWLQRSGGVLTAIPFGRRSPQGSTEATMVPAC